MKRALVWLAAAGLMVATSSTDVLASEDDNPHARAPHAVPLDGQESMWVRAPGEEWFEARAEAEGDRFSWSDEAGEYTVDGVGDGDFEGGWIDAEGEFEFRYDEEEDEFAYWQHLPADRLVRGRQLYVQFCASCHGFDGDGYGRSAQHLRPPPRSFLQSSYKFTKAVVGSLPSDQALLRLVKRGLNGTPMLPWALGDAQLLDIIQYIKTLSPEGEGWRDVYAEINDPVDIGEDPFAGDPAAGVARGEEVYHRIGCYQCHPGYVTPDQINEYAGKDEGTTHRDDLTYSKIVADSVYEVQGYGVSIFPPDFTWHPIRAGWTPQDVAETVAAGIGGAGMPQWKGSITDEEIWAIGYYVRHLVDEYKGQPAKRAAFMAGLRSN